MENAALFLAEQAANEGACDKVSRHDCKHDTKLISIKRPGGKLLYLSYCSEAIGILQRKGITAYDVTGQKELKLMPGLMHCIKCGSVCSAYTLCKFCCKLREAERDSRVAAKIIQIKRRCEGGCLQHGDAVATVRLVLDGVLLGHASLCQRAVENAKSNGIKVKIISKGLGKNRKEWHPMIPEEPLK